MFATTGVSLISPSCYNFFRTPCWFTNSLWGSAWEHESEASSFNLKIKSCRLALTPHSKPRSIISVKTPIHSQNSSTFVPRTNVHLVQGTNGAHSINGSATKLPTSHLIHIPREYGTQMTPSNWLPSNRMRSPKLPDPLFPSMDCSNGRLPGRSSGPENPSPSKPGPSASQTKNLWSLRPTPPPSACNQVCQFL